MTFEDTFRGRPNTIKVYRSLYGCHIKGLVPDPLGGPITEQHLANFIRIWEGRGLAKRTIMSLLRLIKQYSKFNNQPCYDIRHLISGLERSEQQEEVLALNKEQADVLIEICKRLEPRFLPVLLLGLHAGLRRGEVFGLNCSDIDMLKGRVRIARSYDGPTKTGKTRYVPMSTELVRVMTATRNLLFRPGTERIFEVFDPNPVLRRLCYSSSLPELHFHSLRHTFCTIALEKGVSPRQVAAWAGHASVTTTLSIYWNLTGSEVDINNAV